MNHPLNGYILSHTHWDREWYLPFQELRMRLVNLMDTLIPWQETHPEFSHFHLDGQTICLEDYLEIRPAQEKRLKSLIRDGRIAPGPWYVLPDLLCVGQEAVLRNLNLGRKLANAFGGCSPVGYLPDIFSHTSQLPQIFTDYGLQAAVVWRGASGTADELPGEVEWQAPDGTRLLTIHLPDDRGYLNAFPLEDSPEAVSRQFDQWFKERAPFSTTGQILFMNGCDHQNPNYRLPEYIDYYNQTRKDRQLHLVSLEEYISLLKPCLPQLKVITGELNRTNHTAGRHLNPTLKNTLSSRIPQKLRNYQCEALLVRICEPLAAIAVCSGMPTYTHFLDTAWKYLLQNHPHDSICGCSCDQVHLDMEQRFSWCSQIGTQCRNELMKQLGMLQDTRTLPEDYIPVHVFRMLPFSAFHQVHQVTVRLPVHSFLRDLEWITSDGIPLPSQILQVRREGMVLRDFDTDPSWDDYLLVDALVQIPCLPATGYVTLGCRPVDVPRTLPPHNSSLTHTLENEYLKVTISPNGTLSVLQKSSGEVYSDLHLLTDGPDIGDEYIYSPPLVNPVWNAYTHTPSLEIIHGTLCSSAVLTWEYMAPGTVPSTSEYTGLDTYPGQHAPFTQPQVCNRIRTVITLEQGSQLLQFTSTIENHTANHRLQVLFPTGMNVQYSYADSHFDIVKHAVLLEQPSADAWVETENGCYSMKRFVYLEESGRRVTLLSKGLTEYQITHTEAGQAIAVTLLRSVNRVGSQRSLTCYGAPGPKAVYTQDSQLLAPYCVEYALLFQDTQSPLQPLVEEYHSPCCYWQDTRHAPAASKHTDMPPSSLITVTEGANDFVLSAVKPWNKGEEQAILVRGCCLSSDSCQVTLETGFPIRSCRYAAMDETLQHPMPHEDHSITLIAPACKIITFVLFPDFAV